MFICSGDCGRRSLTIHSFDQVHFSIFDLIALWQAEGVQPPSIGSGRMPRTLHTSNSQSARESNFCPILSAIFLGSRGSKLNLAKVLRKYMTLGVYSDALGDHFLSPLARQCTQTAAKIESYGRQPRCFERINAWQEKMRLEADQFLFIRDGLFIFFDPANCSPIIIQTPLRALCVYKKLM